MAQDILCVVNIGTPEFNFKMKKKTLIKEYDEYDNAHYTLDIYAEEYIVFAFPFVCSFVTFMEFMTKFSTKLH